MKTKLLIYAFVLAGAAGAIATQVNLGPVGTYVQALHNAKSLKASFKSVVSSVSPTSYDISFSKDGKYRVETDKTLWVCDGKNLWTLDKVANTYSEGDASLKPLKADQFLEFYGFFDAKQFEDATSITDDGSKQIQGNSAEVYTIHTKDGKTVRLFVGDQNTARGEQVTNGDKSLLTVVKEVKLSDQPLDDSVFTFTAPDGAKKVEAPAAGSTPGYGDVDKIFQANCMPCHSSSRAAGGLDLSSYATLMKGGDDGAMVVAGNADGSALTGYLTGQRRPAMPKGRDPLSATDQQTIHDWIQGGAKGPGN